MILGLYPSTDIFWAKCLVAEWLLVIFTVLIFFKDKWLKLFVTLCMFQYIRTIGISGLARTTGWVAFTYILFFAIIYHVLLLKIRERDTKKIIDGICIIMLIQLAFMWMQYFKMDPLFGLSSIYKLHPSRLTTVNLVTGFWGHTNISGASLAITLPLFFRYNWRLAIIPMVWMIVLTQSLGAVIAAGAGIFFYLCCNKKVTKKIFIMAIIALMSGVLMYGVKVDSSQLSLENSRTNIFKMTWKLIERHPWKGYGLGQYKLAFKAIARGVFKVPQPSTQARPPRNLAACLNVGHCRIVIDRFGKRTMHHAQFFRHGRGMRQQFAHPHAPIVVVVLRKFIFTRTHRQRLLLARHARYPLPIAHLRRQFLAKHRLHRKLARDRVQCLDHIGYTGPTAYSSHDK